MSLAAAGISGNHALCKYFSKWKSSPPRPNVRTEESSHIHPEDSKQERYPAVASLWAIVNAVRERYMNINLSRQIRRLYYVYDPN